MAVDWMDVTSLSFNSLLLLERVQLGWFPGWLPEAELAIALRANPVVEWFLRHKCPQLNGWLDGVLVSEPDSVSSERVRKAEITIMKSINDLLVYVVDPVIYDQQAFLNWDSNVLTSLVDFRELTVIDVGAGTGRLALLVAPMAQAVFAVEPVDNLRFYLKNKARKMGFTNVYPVDGLITELPFPDRFADVTMEAHVFGDAPEQEYQEMVRVTKPGGIVILMCMSGGSKKIHDFLISQGFSWSRFEEPGEGMKRKYWKRIS
jgi:2-polyprenyl-3-methyl-5-hydroxy-6-metoxy-1,4-benzoquinol methylase